jgi:hypothetical protein
MPEHSEDSTAVPEHNKAIEQLARLTERIDELRRYL